MAILLYDGECGVCDRTVRFVLRHDRHRTLQFAALSGEFGRTVIAHHPELAGVDSVIWYEPASDGANGGGVARVRSEAVLALTGYLGGGWRLVQVVRLIPRSLRDAAYDAFARRRYALLGRDMACTLPLEHERHRFLDLSSS